MPKEKPPEIAEKKKTKRTGPILNAIEKEEKYFEHRLYRMHTTTIVLILWKIYLY